MNVEISKSNKEGKKLKAVIDNKKTIHFGSTPYSDFTQHKDEDRKKKYLDRHKKREDWTKTGIDTAGFYAKHLLWSEQTLEKSVDKLNKKYKDIKFTYSPNKKSSYG